MRGVEGAEAQKQAAPPAAQFSRTVGIWHRCVESRMLPGVDQPGYMRGADLWPLTRPYSVGQYFQHFAQDIGDGATTRHTDTELARVARPLQHMNTSGIRQKSDIWDIAAGLTER